MFTENLQPESWLPVVGFEGWYEVSDLGRVRSVDRIARCSRNPARFRTWRGRPIKPCPVNKNGHLAVALSRNGVVSRHLVHHLVLEAFVGPRPPGLQGLHWDDVAANNRVENLRWGTPSDNGYDCTRNGGWRTRTHCPQGHPYSEDNTYVTPRGYGVCRQCRNDKGRSLYWSKRGVTA